jgi:hypothetical protein
VVPNVRERLSVSKQTAHKFYRERFNLRKLNVLEDRKQYQIKVSKRFAALEILSYSKDRDGAWENIKQNIKTSAKESIGL